MDENRLENNENIGEEDYGKTQEMDSIQLPKLSESDHHGITPREEFTELKRSLWIL